MLEVDEVVNVRGNDGDVLSLVLFVWGGVREDVVMFGDEECVVMWL